MGLVIAKSKAPVLPIRIFGAYEAFPRGSKFPKLFTRITVNVGDMIKFEENELKNAVKNNDIVEVADALTDILYVTYGAGHSFGVDLDKCFDEVQRSNMSKLGVDGKPIYNESGKVMKGPDYFAPDLKKIIT